MFLDSLVSNLNQSINRYPDVLNYLESRNVTREEIKEYKIGFSKIVRPPDDGSENWKQFMRDTWKGKKFEGMIVFPIEDIFGRVVGLHGRSPEVKTFCNFILDEAKFSGFFFGLFQSLPSIYESGRAYVSEGPFDHIALKKVLVNSVSTLTAELTDAQYDLLMYFCDNIVTVFDSDKPGREAAGRAEDREHIYTLDLGFKDPAQCLETLFFRQFKEYVLKKVRDLPQF